MTLKFHAKFEEKLTRGLQNDMRSLENFQLKMSKLRVLLNPTTTDPRTHQPLSSYPPTHRPVVINLVKTEDQILNMFCNQLVHVIT